MTAGWHAGGLRPGGSVNGCQFRQVPLPRSHQGAWVVGTGPPPPVGHPRPSATPARRPLTPPPHHHQHYSPPWWEEERKRKRRGGRRGKKKKKKKKKKKRRRRRRRKLDAAGECQINSTAIEIKRPTRCVIMFTSCVTKGTCML